MGNTKEIRIGYNCPLNQHANPELRSKRPHGCQPTELRMHSTTHGATTQLRAESTTYARADSTTGVRAESTAGVRRTESTTEMQSTSIYCPTTCARSCPKGRHLPEMLLLHRNLLHRPVLPRNPPITEWSERRLQSI